MSNQHQTTSGLHDTRREQKNKPTPITEQIGSQIIPTKSPDDLLGIAEDASIQAQASYLNDTRFQTIQRQAMAAQIGQVQGNRHLQRVISSLGQHNRKSVLVQTAETETGGVVDVVQRDVVQRDVLPVAKFSPAPGVFVDRTENLVSISGAMELYGPEATAARAASVQNSINTTWTRAFPDGSSVSCNITVTYRAPGSQAGNATQIEAVKISGPSHVSPGLNGRSMTLNANESDAFAWTAAHEFGHIIGLDDRYSEGIISKVMGTFGGTRTTTVQPGYKGNIMAVGGGALEGKNVADVAEENEPSPYWINDDDQIRDWVNGHSPSDIGSLSITSKLKAIKVLMGGWISDDDVAAIARICSGVTSSTEAAAIRNGVDLLDMNSIGQRTAVRVAFAKMP